MKPFKVGFTEGCFSIKTLLFHINLSLCVKKIIDTNSKSDVNFVFLNQRFTVSSELKRNVVSHKIMNV